MLRINKYLARCGAASRRAADKLVARGRVTVNGAPVVEMGYMVDETRDLVCLDGQPIRPASHHVYILMNKPAGYLTSWSDPHHEKTVMTLLKNLAERVSPVGRLDLDTEGTLLLTNDGELAFRLTHPRYGIKRIYRATVEGKVTPEKLELLSRGIKLPDGSIGRALARVEKSGQDDTILNLELTEGRKREVRHLCQAIGHPVIHLFRSAFAGIECGGLNHGSWRHLTPEEVAGLYDQVGLRT